MGTLGLIAVHGMGKTEANFADKFFEDVRDRLSDAQSAKLETATVYYQDILQPHEEAYFNKTKRKLDWLKLRQFVLYGFCDAASLESRKEGAQSPYFLAQKKILQTLKRMHSLNGKTAPIVVVAQSLGGQVLSNYLWDALKKDQPANGIWSSPPQLSPDEEWVCRGRTIERLFTTGCNIPVFVAGHPANKIKAIPKPNDRFRWDNYYDEDDVLGWPLKDLSESYKKLVTDRKINAGFFSGITPFSHTQYWSDRDFLIPLVGHLKRLI
ncbi:hypothetical protein [Roseibium sediminicola]|uniref:Uncharacterized protein n=1 Tax=Roseibium sediminicola TaxID=2933272 RepID=A0ABT0GP14_9HYPH|nr:hypothetical protein [Roseibium sp. CAU 1639]MCK7611167.1 hypothetical protein [Roseibium sp. CAU 1639]